MARNARQRFDDPQAFETAIRAANLENYTALRRGTFDAKLTRIDFVKLWFQRGSESLPRLADIVIDAGRLPIFFLADADQGAVTHSGREIGSEEVAFYSRSESFIQRIAGPCRWATLSLAPHDLEEAGRLLADCHLVAPSEAAILRPSPQALARLRALHAEAQRLAEEATSTLALDGVAAAMEDALVRAFVDCIGDGRSESPGPAWHRHRRILSAFQAWLEAHSSQPVHLLDICRALDVPARTLRLVCEEYFGMGPIRYLSLRRMGLARSALLAASPESATVTSVAMEFGFWQLGRFAVRYHALFGETPSETLRAAPRYRSH